MLGRLFLLFVIVPILDLALLVTIGREMGFWPTMALVVLTALIGSHLARREGLATWNKVQSELSRGTVPGAAVVDGLIILVAGTLLLTPGFITDVVGIFGLIPASRRRLSSLLHKRFEGAVQTGPVRIINGQPTGSPFVHREPAIEDAEVIDDGSGSR